MMAVSAFTAIVVPSKDQLVATLDTVIAGVKAGELDEHLAQYAKARGVPKSTRAA
jgi:iron uptake system EfeUOB component EfeO/EfeM